MRTPAARMPLALAMALLLGVAAPSHAQVQVLAVEPSRDDANVLCHVRTAGLPDARSRETLASGLPSSLTFSFVLVDRSGREHGGSTAEIRIEPDPWERAFVVRGPRIEHRAASLEEVSGFLARLGPFPVAPVRRLDAGRPLRVRVRLELHALAPAEAERAHALFAGDMGVGGADRREVSAGLGQLLRFFLGRTPAGPWSAEAMSPAIDPRTLPRAP